MINQEIEPSEKSGIQKLLQDYYALDHFRQLQLKDRYFKKIDESSDEEEGVPVVFRCIPPPSKKQKV